MSVRVQPGRQRNCRISSTRRCWGEVILRKHGIAIRRDAWRARRGRPLRKKSNGVTASRDFRGHGQGGLRLAIAGWSRSEVDLSHHVTEGLPMPRFALIRRKPEGNKGLRLPIVGKL